MIGINYDFAPLNNTKLVFPSRSGSLQGALVFSRVLLPTQPLIRSYMQQGAIGVIFDASSSKVKYLDSFPSDLKLKEFIVIRCSRSSNVCYRRE
jgi:hypothetical protein